MTTGVKAVLGSVALLAVAVGGELLWLHHRDAADAAVPKQTAYVSDPDDLVFLKKERPDSLKDEKALKGRTLWVAAGGQLDYYPYVGHHVDYAKSQGVLLGADPLTIVDAVEEVAPKSATFRIPGGDKQVLLVFTKPGVAGEFAVPVGFKDQSGYTFSTDEIFFYDDPHQLFSYWSPEIWKAIDAHTAMLGMNERQMFLALGQVSKPDSDNYGNRTIVFDNGGHPQRVMFEKGKATEIKPE
jgi:hypothetical protein